MSAYQKSVYKRNITPAQSKDAGMALVLIFLLIGIFAEQLWAFEVAIVVLIVDMIWPGVYKPFAWFWYGLAEILGSISSRIILTIIYISIVLPVGLVRKALGRDKLMLKAFKKDNTSALIRRDHLYTKTDMEQLF